MRRKLREFILAVKSALSQFRRERESQARVREVERLMSSFRRPVVVNFEDWPPKNANPTFGNATSAKPRFGVAQDPKLVEAVEEALANGKKCPSCGHDTGSNTWARQPTGSFEGSIR